ncbi:hypothetical protein BLOT_015529 [Blomia tropicalis]|nr:hypothetical protein BLOT_015529 [Blomia tropicalis]
MNQTTIKFLFGAFVFLCLMQWNTTEAGDKGDLYILGGSKKCGPGLLYKSKGKKGKKGELVIMNSCHEEDEVTVHNDYSMMYMPMYHGYGHGHGYGYGGGGGGGGGGGNGRRRR